MRHQIDAAILHQTINEHWFTPELERVRSTLTRIQLHDLDWEDAQGLQTATAQPQEVRMRSDLLYQAAVRLRRYDVLLVPVSRQTLGWTRRLLASIPRGPQIPLLGILHQIQAGGMIDLMELGMVDFVQTPVADQELRARILCAVSRAPAHRTLREPMAEASTALPSTPARVYGQKRSAAGGQKTFKDAKSALISQFECQYVRDALIMQQGNVARAAAASGKNRRAFWEIMRKHQIDAAQFRPAHGDSGAQKSQVARGI